MSDTQFYDHHWIGAPAAVEAAVAALPEGTDILGRWQGSLIEGDPEMLLVSIRLRAPMETPAGVRCASCDLVRGLLGVWA